VSGWFLVRPGARAASTPTPLCRLEINPFGSISGPLRARFGSTEPSILPNYLQPPPCLDPKHARQAHFCLGHPRFAALQRVSLFLIPGLMPAIACRVFAGDDALLCFAFSTLQPALPECVRLVRYKHTICINRAVSIDFNQTDKSRNRKS
jgi:hypothetical protein